MLTWEPWGVYAQKSKCDRYGISAAKVMGKWIYTLWEIPGKQMGNFPSAEAAKAAADGSIVGRPVAIADAGSQSKGHLVEKGEEGEWSKQKSLL